MKAAGNRDGYPTTSLTKPTLRQEVNVAVSIVAKQRLAVFFQIGLFKTLALLRFNTEARL